MEEKPVKPPLVKKTPARFYVITSFGLVVTILLLAGAIIFREEIRNLGGYGYIGVFAVGLIGGISIIPAPTMAMAFFLGGTLNPLFVGLAAGFGGTVGGITVYLTGAGVETIWSRIKADRLGYEDEAAWRYDPVRPVESRIWSKGEALYNKLVKWMGGRAGYWTLFVSAALVGGPYYFAGLAAGSLRIGLGKFLAITLPGKIIRYMTIAYAGYFGLYVLLRWIAH